jgi:glycosyltransferase involved in cell wall biosynthesis
VVVLTSADPGARTGGSLYHRRIAERAPAWGVEVEIRPLGRGRVATAEADVVVVDSIVAARVAARLEIRRPGAPIVASVHQRPGGLTGVRPGRAVRRALDLRLYRHAEAVVVPSAYLADVLARSGLARARLAVVEPGCERAVVEAERTPSGGPASFLSVANLSPHKRPLDLIEAFAALGDVDATLTMIGGCADARLGRRVETRLRRPDVAGRARWMGSQPRDRVLRAMLEADVFVSPALGESYSIAVAEAVAGGLPAIVAASGNLPTLVRDGVEGLVVRPRDPRALAAAMRRLATDAGARERMGSAALERGRELPGWDDTARAFVGVLEGVQARGRSAA